MGRGAVDAELNIEIVGLVKDAKHLGGVHGAGADFSPGGVKNPVPPQYVLPSSRLEASRTFYARTTLPPDTLLRSIPTLMARLDPDLPVNDLTTLPQLVREKLFLDWMITILSAAFALLATLLAAVGLYGVLAYTVAQRTHDFGVRMALGADAARLRAMVLGPLGRMTLIGGAVGLVVALGLERVARSLLFEIDGIPPGLIVAVVLALGAVALSAGLIPAHRASRINPMTALRHQ